MPLPPTPFLTIAHRGARSIAPENTLVPPAPATPPAPNLWETDVAVTADGELVLFHDDSLARTTDAETRFPDRSPWTVTLFTLAEIRSLDAGSWFVEQDPFGQIAAGAVTPQQADNFRGERIPTVREALQLTKDLDWRINLELKRLPAPHQEFPVVEAVFALIDEVGIPSERVILSSFRHEWLSQAQRLRPEVEVQALVGYWEDEALDWDIAPIRHLQRPSHPDHAGRNPRPRRPVASTSTSSPSTTPPTGSASSPPASTACSPISRKISYCHCGNCSACSSRIRNPAGRMREPADCESAFEQIIKQIAACLSSYSLRTM